PATSAAAPDTAASSPPSTPSRRSVPVPAPSLPSTFTRTRRAPGLGESVLRPDAPAKTKGEFAFSSDLYLEGMVWGATLRSPHPHARIRSLDPAPALAISGVHAVITNDDLWGSRTYGLEHHNQPVFADGAVRFHGEPVAAVAAGHPEAAPRAPGAAARHSGLQVPG